MQTDNQTYISDALSHLDVLKTDFSRLRLDYNRDSILVYAMGRYIDSCELIGQLIKGYDNHNLKLLSSCINSVLLRDSELHGILVTIKKKKNLENFDHSKMASIIFEI
jgi:hypothetical protein